MIIEIDLEKFMIWLTGNDKNLSITIPDEIAVAINKDPNRDLVVMFKLVPPSGSWYVQSAEGYVNSFRKEDLASVLGNALGQGKMNIVKLIQERMRQDV